MCRLEQNLVGLRMANAGGSTWLHPGDILGRGSNPQLGQPSEKPLITLVAIGYLRLFVDRRPRVRLCAANAGETTSGTRRSLGANPRSRLRGSSAVERRVNVSSIIVAALVRLARMLSEVHRFRVRIPAAPFLRGRSSTAEHPFDRPCRAAKLSVGA